MGLNHSIIKTNTEIYDELTQINSITTNELFYKRTGFFIKFQITGCQLLCRRIKGKMYKIMGEENQCNGADFCLVEGEKIVFKTLTLSIVKFYRFYNVLSVCLPIFYDSNVRTVSITPKYTEFELCPICVENPPNMILDCNHIFCTKCIKIWLFKKQKVCPMCRTELNDTQSDQFSNKEYIILGKNDLNNLDSIEDMDKHFVIAVGEIL